jgi:hypothetical protein
MKFIKKIIRPCGKILKMTDKEKLKYLGRIKYTEGSMSEHYCGRPKGHKGKHKCLYTECTKRW